MIPLSTDDLKKVCRDNLQIIEGQVTTVGPVTKEWATTLTSYVAELRRRGYPLTQKDLR